MKNSRIIFLGLALLVCTLGHSQPYAIPGALGFGKEVRGAYEGSSNPTILYVDRLTDDLGNNGTNKGSLRWCLTRNYPRIILFEVSGYINLTSYIRVTDDYVSIYGQTAPSPGITVSGVDVIDFRCNYVVLQHLRFRSSYNNYGGDQVDALTVYQGSNVFIDHCSFSYAEDECLGIGGANGTFTGPLTVQNCIFSWPLHYNTGKGMLLGGDFDSTSVVRSAFIHCADRTPFPGDSIYTAFEVVNTLSYNCAYFGISFADSDSAKYHVIGNEWRSGPNSSGQREVLRIRSAMNSFENSYYLYDNYSPTRVGVSEWDSVVYYENSSKDSSDYKSDTPFSGYETNYYSYTALDDSLTANAGARPWDRDSVDILALNDMVNQTGSWITYQSEAYYPQLAQNTTTLNVPDNPHSNSGDGYTNLEKWVYEMTTGTSDTTSNDTTSSGSSELILLTDTANNGGDVAHYNWLVANGFEVTKLDIGNDIDLTSPSQDLKNQLDTAGLVIVGRDANSNKYDGRGQDVIDSILAPVITVNPYGAQWGDPPLWFKSASVSASPDGEVWIDVTSSDTIFTYANVIGDSMAYSNGAFGLISTEGTHNGTIIGSKDGDIAIVRFAKNVAYNDSTNANTPLSDRTIFPFNTNSDTSFFSLTTNGQAAYYAEICRLLGEPVTPPQYYFCDNSLKDIVLLTDTANNGGDTAHYNWLDANGFDVTKLDIGTNIDLTSPSQEVINQLNTADLVIVGRDANSNKYDGRGQDVIDSITAPVITVNPYGAQWGDPPMWFKSASVSGVSGSSIYIDVADDTIFTNSNVAGDSILYGNSSFGVITASGTHNGTVIGSVDDDITIVRFAKNVPYNDSTNAKTPLSDRTIFSFDNDATSFSLTQDGQAAYYAEIRRLIGYSIEPPVYYSTSNKSAKMEFGNPEIISENNFPFLLYPNPAEKQLTVDDLKVGTRVYIFNFEGKTMVKTVALDNKLDLNISSYKPGVYIVKIETNSKSYSSKFIKQ